MSEAYVSQVMAFGFGWAPRNWALCNGQIMAIQQNTALFSLVGTMYGGNGTVTFGLPNLQSSVMLHKGTAPWGTVYEQGETGGVENVTITNATMPAHNHNFFGTTDPASNPQPQQGAALANIGAGSGSPGNYYAPDTTVTALNPASLSLIGGSQGHGNIQPYLAISWCICTAGIYPSRN